MPVALSNHCQPATGLLNLVALSGNVRTPSRTAALVSAIGKAIVNHLQVSQLDLTMAALGPTILGALTRDALSAEGLAIVRHVETADILIVGSPIYRASYSGALKHLFDLVDYRGLTGAVGVIAATGGTALHALATEHQFRPLLGFFGIISVPTTVYALETDFEGAVLTNARVHDRIEQAAVETAVLAPLALRRREARRAAA